MARGRRRTRGALGAAARRPWAAGLWALVGGLGGARAQDWDWESCDLATCTCAGFCLDALRDTTYSLSAADGQRFFVRLCDALPDEPQTAPPDAAAGWQPGAQGCLGCTTVADMCTVVRTSGTAGAHGREESCDGAGSVGGCGFGESCGMSGRATPGGGLDIRYQFADSEHGEYLQDDFILHVHPGMGEAEDFSDVARLDFEGDYQYHVNVTAPAAQIVCAGAEPAPPPPPPSQADCEWLPTDPFAQYFELNNDEAATSADECQANCCADLACEVWQYSTEPPAGVAHCVHGASDDTGDSFGVEWQGGTRPPEEPEEPQAEPQSGGYKCGSVLGNPPSCQEVVPGDVPEYPTLSECSAACGAGPSPAPSPDPPPPPPTECPASPGGVHANGCNGVYHAGDECTATCQPCFNDDSGRISARFTCGADGMWEAPDGPLACTAQTCSNHGTCNPSDSTCVCSGCHHGDNCETDTCAPNGHCDDKSNDCLCNPGYAGDTCTDMPEPEPEAMECDDAYSAVMKAMLLDGEPCHKAYPCASAAQPTSCCPDEPNTPCQRLITNMLVSCKDQVYNFTDPITGRVEIRSLTQNMVQAFRNADVMGYTSHCDFHEGYDTCNEHCTISDAIAALEGCAKWLLGIQFNGLCKPGGDAYSGCEKSGPVCHGICFYPAEWFWRR